jgi:DNA (cytosine-5)-methyltransferase 1
MNEKAVLDKAFQDAMKLIESKKINTTPTYIKHDVDMLIDKIGSNKSLVSALATSLVKKILDSNQDIRLHRTDFEGGYSARSLDTHFTSPFFKDHFPKYANKESSFLTLATRERIPWTKKDGINLKIRNKKLRECFLNIFEQVELNKRNPKHYLNYLFAKLILLSKQDELLFQAAEKQTSEIRILNIRLILEMLHRHFETKLSSRLPVIAIYSIYEMLLPNVERYKDKTLLPLQVHTSSDKHGFGDIEIYDKENNPFEIIEIKHNIPINRYLIFYIEKKIRNTQINRYYILTTFQNGFLNQEEEKSVTDYILQIKRKSGIDIIANGIATTLKYYLRFIDDYELFIKIYTNNLLTDAKNSTEVKNFHIEEWSKILNEYKLDM